MFLEIVWEDSTDLLQFIQMKFGVFLCHWTLMNKASDAHAAGC